MPADIAADLASGHRLARQGLLTHAEAVYRRVLAAQPDHADASYSLGVVLRDQGRLPEAEAAFRAALAVRPGHAESHNNLGVVLMGQRRTREAVASFEQALALKPEHGRAHNNLGAARMELGDLEAATDCFSHAIALNPGHAKAHNNLGVARQYQGRLVEAAQAFARAAAADPAYAEALFNLAGLTPPGPQAEALAATLAEQALTARDPQARSALLFALGGLLEQGGDFGGAFDAWAEANALRRAGLTFDMAAAEARMAAIVERFDAQTLARLAGQGVRSHRPIFVIGMPRSGTTLVEQVLAAHPQVQGAGELRLMGELASGLLELDGPACARLGQAYLDGLPPAPAGRTRATDKAVSNIEAMGLIHLCLPDAVIIHVRRDARDAALSCFATRFTDGQDFAYDLGELGRYWRAYERLMDHWRSVLPEGRLLEVDYEMLTQDLEPQARRLVAHCGLDWDEACLRFHDSGREVRTASAAQVRRPIHTRSVGRWRRFEDRLGPLLAALGER